MYSTIGMYNLALARLGGNELTSLSSTGDDSRLAALCNTLFPHIRDLTLAAHPWSFAMDIETLALKGAGNDRYHFSYALPPSCVRPVRLVGKGFDNTPVSYELHGADLFTDVSPAVLHYVRRMHDPSLWPAHFADAVTWGLAAELCTAYVNDSQRQRFCLDMRERALNIGRAADLSFNSPKRSPCLWDEARG